LPVARNYDGPLALAFVKVRAKFGFHVGHRSNFHSLNSSPPTNSRFPSLMPIARTQTSSSRTSYKMRNRLLGPQRSSQVDSNGAGFSSGLRFRVSFSGV